MTPLHFPFPVLVTDIGGTNARFGFKADAAGKLDIAARLKTGDFTGLGAAINSIAGKLPRKPRSVIACGAGPVDGRRLQLTNASWLIDGPLVAQETGLEQGLLLNDFEALALALPAIPAEWTRSIGPQGAGKGPRLILGPGTGLGIGALLEMDGRYVPVSSEACHMGYGPGDAEQEKLWPHLERVFGRVTTESVMSGAGLARLNEARRLAASLAPDNADAAAVTARAVADSAGFEAETVRLYWRVVARFAGDMAIVFMATGGVTLAGGVLPRVTALLNDAEFRRCFEDKAPVDGLARRCATRLITAPDAVLAGMAAIAAMPGRYAVDYAARAWA